MLAPSDAELSSRAQRDASLDVSAADSTVDARNEEAAYACTDSSGCPEGTYCRRGECGSCDDVSAVADPRSLEFGEPEALQLINQSVEIEALLFPRRFGAGLGLLYQREFYGGVIWLSGDFQQTPGAALPVPGHVPSASERGAFSLPKKIPGALADYDFFFHRNEPSDAAALTRADLYGAELDRSGTITGIKRLPPPFNPPLPTKRSSYSLVLAHDRAFWMVNNDGVLDLQLLTAPLTGDPLPAEVELKLSSGCALSEFDFAPWTTPDGRLLFVSARERSATCEIPSAEPTDIFVVRLSSAGQPLGPISPLKGLSRPGRHEMHASLSPDACWLYWTGNQTAKDKLRLYRSRRIR